MAWRNTHSLKFIILNRIKNKTVYKRIAIWLLTILYLGLIFLFSNQTGPQSNKISNEIANEIKQTVSLPHILHEKNFIRNLDYNYILRKCAHVTEYFLLFILLYIALRLCSQKIKTSTIFAFTFCIIFSCLDEFHQSLIGSRTPALKDVIIDVSGALLGFISIYTIKLVKCTLEKIFYS